MNSSVDGFKHGIQLLQHVGIPEAKDGEPLALKELAASLIFLLPLSVLTSVKLDDKLALDATEVDDERWNRVLAPKFRAVALSGPQTLPEPALRVSLIVS